MYQLIAAYFSLLLGACLSTGIGLVLVNSFSWEQFIYLGSFAGLSAVLSALIMTKAYLYSLHTGKYTQLKIQAVIGIMLATILFGLITAGSILFNYLHWSNAHAANFLATEFLFTAILFSALAGFLGFIPNYLFILGFNAVVSRSYQAKIQGLKLHLN